ncbi:unnamed protein product [Meganyctiphanes norvegica]|uniref:Angio-associated migratory cell protein n=1 Tax=Meganyctiphanes norvegica TaxID=48144 RepID=A0AAV2QS85_MEGNR
MRDNTPPRSPSHDEFDNNDDDAFNINDIIEVIDLDDNTNLEDVADQLIAAAGGEGEDEEEMDEDEDSENDVTEMAKKVFLDHKGSIFDVAVSPSNLAVTGGEDDLAHVWEINTGNKVFTCTGHKDSVTCVDFNHDGSLLATGDMAGYIQVWNVSSQSKIWEFETGDLNWMKWHHASNVLLSGTNEGELWMWLIPQGNTRTFPNYGVATNNGGLMKDGKRAVLGYDDGSVRVFDLKTTELAHQFSAGLAQDSAITSLATHENNTLIIAGSLDGSARIYNANNGKVVGTLNCQVNLPSESEGMSNMEETPSHTVEVVGFCPTLPNIAVTGTLAGFISIWDINTQQSRHVIAQGCGSSQLAWHPTEPILFTAGLDGAVRAYDVRSGQALEKYTGHRQSILAIDVTKDGTALVSTSDDGTARVFSLVS